jgi:hypothetical protein
LWGLCLKVSTRVGCKVSTFGPVPFHISHLAAPPHPRLAQSEQDGVWQAGAVANLVGILSDANLRHFENT